MKIIAVIPARYKSTRLEGKPLADIDGKPMIQHVYERASKSNKLDDIIVATDDKRIIDIVNRFGGKAELTSELHPSGSDRVAEVAEKLDADIIVNVQGDEPFINPEMIDEVIDPFKDTSLVMATLMHEVLDEKDFENPNVVKVVVDKDGFALYFSRSLIPYPRNKIDFHVYEHIGLYAYRKDFLLKFTKLSPTPLEKIESLEQLRVLENGFKIKVILTEKEYIPLSVDTQEDLEKARKYAKQLGKKEN